MYLYFSIPSSKTQTPISYQYSGNFGDNVFVGAEMATNGNSSRYYAHRPAMDAPFRAENEIEVAQADIEIDQRHPRAGLGQRQAGISQVQVSW